MSLFLLQLLVSAFLAILFLQSGVDKIVDRQGPETEHHRARNGSSDVAEGLHQVLQVSWVRRNPRYRLRVSGVVLYSMPRPELNHARVLGFSRFQNNTLLLAKIEHPSSIDTISRLHSSAHRKVVMSVIAIVIFRISSRVQRCEASRV